GLGGVARRVHAGLRQRVADPRLRRTRPQFQRYHLCFRVSDADFDSIFGRIQSAGLAYRSRPRGENDMLINRRLGGKNVYWEDGDGHLWEILTVSYARADAPAVAATP